METRSGRERERKSNFSTRCYFCLVFLRRVQKIPLDFCVWGISRVFLLSCFSPFFSMLEKAFIPERQRRKHDALMKEKEKEKEKEREEERGEKKKKKKKRRV